MKSKVIKVALTGGIASGKSLVSDLLEIHGCKIIDLDVISREVVMLSLIHISEPTRPY